MTSRPHRPLFAPARWWSVGLVLILGLTTAACSGGSDENTPGTSSGPKAGGQLTIGSPLDPNGLDPVRMSSFNDEITWHLVYDSLFQRMEYGAVPAPALAESLTPSSDLKTWTLKIRSGVKFSDGTPLDAAAVKANLDRHLAKDSPSGFKGTLADISGSAVVDPTTLTINLSSPWANLVYALTFPIASPVAVAAAGDDFNRKPVGSGPYTLTEWVNGDRLTFAKRADYWGEAAGISCCYPDTVVIKIIPDANTRQQALQTGEIDVNIQPRSEDVRAAERSGGSLTATMAPDGAAPGLLVTFNLNDQLVSDLRVRTAMAYSIDRDALANLENGLIKTHPGPFAGTPWDNGTAYPGLDLAKAQAAVDAYKTEHNQPLIISMRYATGQEKPAQALQAMWKEVGIETKLIGADVNATIDAILKGDFQALLLGTGFISPHPDFTLPIFLGSAAPLKANAKADTEIDAALKAARSTTDVTAQKAAYKVIDDKWAKDLIWIWTNTGFQAIETRSCVKGAALTGKALTNTGMPNLSAEIWTEC